MPGSIVGRGRDCRGRSCAGAGAWCPCRGVVRAGTGRGLAGLACERCGGAWTTCRCRRGTVVACRGVAAPLCDFEGRFGIRRVDATSTSRSRDDPCVGSRSGEGRAGATVRPPGARPGSCKDPPAGRDTQPLVVRRTAAAAARRSSRRRTSSRCRRPAGCPNDAPSGHADEGPHRTPVGLPADAMSPPYGLQPVRSTHAAAKARVSSSATICAPGANHRLRCRTS